MDKVERDRLRALAGSESWNGAPRVSVLALLDALDAAEAERDTAKRVATLLGDHTQNGIQLLAALAAAEQKAIDLRAKLDTAEARVAQLDGVLRLCEMCLVDVNRKNPQLATIRRATVEAIVRRLRELGGETAYPESCVGYYRAANMIEREFLTEKGGA